MHGDPALHRTGLLTRTKCVPLVTRARAPILMHIETTTDRQRTTDTLGPSRFLSYNTLLLYVFERRV